MSNSNIGGRDELYVSRDISINEIVADIHSGETSIPLYVEKLPFKPGSFVERAELSKIQELLERFDKKDEDEQFINVCVVNGLTFSGKTWLLQGALDQFLNYSVTGHKDTGRRFGCCLDMSEYKGEESIIGLLNDLMSKVKDLFHDEKNKWELEKYSQFLKCGDLVGATTILVNIIRRASDLGYKGMIALDGVDGADDEVLIWVQKRVISPLIKTSTLFVLSACNYTDVLLDFSVKQVATVLPLVPVGLEESNGILMNLGIEDQATREYIYTLSGGNLYAIGVLGNLYLRRDCSIVDSTRVLEPDEGLTPVSSDSIEISDVLQAIIGHWISGLSDETIGGLVYMSGSPYFSFQLLGNMTKEFQGERYSSIEGYRILSELGSIGLATLDCTAGGRFRALIDPSLLNLMDQYLCRKYPEFFERRNAIIDDWHHLAQV